MPTAYCLEAFKFAGAIIYLFFLLYCSGYNLQYNVERNDKVDILALFIFLRSKFSLSQFRRVIDVSLL